MTFDSAQYQRSAGELGPDDAGDGAEVDGGGGASACFPVQHTHSDFLALVSSVRLLLCPDEADQRRKR